MNETKEMDELERRSGVKEIGGGSEGGNGQKRRGKERGKGKLKSTERVRFS